jgi:ribosomal RNA assembly protein
MAEKNLNMNKIYLKIPLERVGALVGCRGGAKAELEKGTGTTITIDGKTGEVLIEAPVGCPNPAEILRARDIVTAVGRGFSPHNASRLFSDGQLLEVIDLKQVIGDSQNKLTRLKGRVIGENGKTWKLIEQLAGVSFSVYGHTIAIIGDYEEMSVAKEAVEMLLRGCMHGTVYKYLNKEHLELKKRKFALWEPRIEIKPAEDEKPKEKPKTRGRKKKTGVGS